MTKYSYKAKNKEGDAYEGTFDANTRVELYAHIRSEGGHPLIIKEISVNESFEARILSMFNGIKTHDKIIFAKNLGSMIRAGLSVTRALNVMQKQAKSKALKKLLEDLESAINKGEPLSVALKKHEGVFSPLFISMVAAGEESGNLSNSLDIVAGQMEKSYLLAKKVRGALIYPAVILSIMVVISILMLIYMVPTLTATFQGIGIELPLSTRIIIGASDFLIHHTLIVIAAFIFLAFGIVTMFKSPQGKRVMDVVILRIPVIGGIAKEVQSARTARTLSSLLSSGVSIIEAMDVTVDVMQNHLYKEVLKEARNAVEKGDSISLIFDKYLNLYPPFVSEMISVGEETGKISEMLFNVATYYENEVEEKTKDLSTIIEPLLMVIIGAGVGVFAVSMLAPTYSLVNNI
ncbi:type II secretion system F family protein [Candidatus Parcubacteria bacterium]|nr:type II secretion system F family protein [Candidatus Parcubacteria bacterium]